MTQDWDMPQAALERLQKSRYPHWENYYGFYSSWLGGYFREPWAMMMPIDDHGFHRGDALFEAVRIHNGAFFDLAPHLRRLQNSADLVGMVLPKSIEEITHICVELARRCATPEGLLRLYITRGPGGFSTSPKEVIGHQIYAAITKLKPPTPEQYVNGITAMTSTIEPKEPFWARIKSCNYLQNVLIKQECLEKGVDFAVTVDSLGRVCEGSTENIMVLSADNELRIPRFDYTLRGITVGLVMKLAESLVQTGRIRSVRLADITREDILRAREVAFVGTTLGVLPVRELDAQTLGTGQQGEIFKFLQESLYAQMSTNPEHRTPF